MLGTLIIPFTFTLLWLSVFGNSALYEIIHGGAAFAEEAMVHPERGFYSLLARYPAFTFSASVATITGLLFYVTSADSGALVLGISPRSLKISTATPRLAARLLVGGDWPADARHADD